VLCSDCLHDEVDLKHIRCSVALYSQEVLGLSESLDLCLIVVGVVVQVYL